MKKIAILSLAAAMFAACGGTTTTVNTNVSTNRAATTNAPAANQNNSVVISSHSTDQTALSSSSSTNQPSQSSPNQKPIDVTAMTAKIEKTDKDLKAKPDDDKTKKAAASAYFERAFALTDAAQYRSALGDFRKGLKLNPDDKDAQAMHDRIVEILTGMGREVPKEGTEPTPLPFSKS